MACELCNMRKHLLPGSFNTQILLMSYRLGAGASG